MERNFYYPKGYLPNRNTKISIAKARRILGAQAKDMTDDQVRELLVVLTLLAKENVLYNGSKKEDSSNVAQ
jgi:hypothetical protein